MTQITGKTVSTERGTERLEGGPLLTAIGLTLLLTAGLFFFVRPVLLSHPRQLLSSPARMLVFCLYALFLLFDVVIAYQHFQVKKIRLRFAEREDLFRLIGEHAADMIAVIDASGRRLYNSPSYERILGYAPEELQKTPAFEQIHPDDRARVQEIAAQTIKTGRGQQLEYRMKHKNGTWVQLESTARAVLDSEGRVDKLVIVNRDITERNRLQQQVQQAQKMSALGRMSGGIAHDFNNVLGVIIAYCEHLKELVGDSPAARNSIDEMLKAGRRGATLTSELVAFSRLQVFNPEVLDLNEVVSRLRYMLERVMGPKIKIMMNLDRDAGAIYADQGQMEQIILNLAMNARDAMNAGGVLTISTSNVQIDHASTGKFTRPIPPGSYVLLTVRDSGEGISPELKSRIFEPFFTTRKSGSAIGLGLSMVEGVVKQSGGSIEVVSEIDSGTEFQIYLPRKPHKALQETVSAAGSDFKSKNRDKTVLVVQEEAASRNLAVTTLERNGYRVLSAHDGVEALDLSRKFSGKIDLVLTDLVMEGISGRELAKRMVLDRPSIHIMYMSSFGEQNLEKLPVLPGSCSIQKPLTREELAEKIHEALSRPSELQRA